MMGAQEPKVKGLLKKKKKGFDTYHNNGPDSVGMEHQAYKLGGCEDLRA